ncbi:hypothetical protein IIC38_18065 [candidate division KSB1 bacterium]|nr:hypothetical protein [candidate division KSB1 bacterium]
MKTKTILLAIVTFALLTTTAFAKIWRVDNNPANISDFTTLQEAHDGALTGDTLYVYGSGLSYGHLNLTKTLYIFGPGYLLNENPETQVSFLSAKVGQVIFNTGSEGSLLTGLYQEGNNGIEIYANNIIIKRNFTEDNLIIDSAASNVIIIQNYLSGGSFLAIGASCQNIIIHNNYISDGNQFVAISMDATASADIRNNVISSHNQSFVTNSIFYNNIGSGTIALLNCDVQNNIGNSNQFGTLNGNQENVDMNMVFVGEGSTDGQWQLAPGSPAIGAGITGEDCGIFGGNEPYRLSGVPAIPAIWFFDAPTSGSTNSGLQVNVKVKSHN